MLLLVCSRHLCPAALQFTSNFLSCVVGKCFPLLLLCSVSVLLTPRRSPPSFDHICLPPLCNTRVICIQVETWGENGSGVHLRTVQIPLCPTPTWVLSDLKWRRLTVSPLAFRGMSSLQPCDGFFPTSICKIYVALDFYLKRFFFTSLYSAQLFLQVFFFLSAISVNTLTQMQAVKWCRCVCFFFRNYIYYKIVPFFDRKQQVQ